MATALNFRFLKPSATLLYRTAAVAKRSFHNTIRRAVSYPNASLETFKKAVGTKDRLVIVDFYADWCGPCHQLSPILDKITEDPNKTPAGLPMDLVKIDTDTDDGVTLGQEYKIHSLPTVIAFRNGEPVGKFVGALNVAGVERFLQGL